MAKIFIKTFMIASCGKPNAYWQGCKQYKKPRRFRTGVLHSVTAPPNSAAVIHVILHRVWRHAVAVLFFLFQFEIAVDLVLGEYTALGEEVVV
jgi:hypothetical protein